MAGPSPLVTLRCKNHIQKLTEHLWQRFLTNLEVDVALEWAGHTVLAHRMVIEAFLLPEKLNRREEIGWYWAEENECLDSLMEFLYRGHVTVRHDQLDNLLEVARETNFQELVESLETVAKTMSGETSQAVENPVVVPEVPNHEDQGDDPDYDPRPDMADDSDAENVVVYMVGPSEAADQHDHAPQLEIINHSDGNITMLMVKPSESATQQDDHTDDPDNDGQSNEENIVWMVQNSDTAAQQDQHSDEDPQPDIIDASDGQITDENVVYMIVQSDDAADQQDHLEHDQQQLDIVDSDGQYTEGNVMVVRMEQVRQTPQQLVIYQQPSPRELSHQSVNDLPAKRQKIEAKDLMAQFEKIMAADLVAESEAEKTAVATVLTATNQKPSINGDIPTRPSSWRDRKKWALRGPIPETFKCPKCNKTYKRPYHLDRHFRTHNININEKKPYMCTECNKTFGDSGNLSRHLKIHSNEKPHQCDLCQKSFSRGAQLEAHLRSCGRPSSRQREIKQQQQAMKEKVMHKDELEHMSAENRLIEAANAELSSYSFT